MLSFDAPERLIISCYLSCRIRLRDIFYPINLPKVYQSSQILSLESHSLPLIYHQQIGILKRSTLGEKNEIGIMTTIKQIEIANFKTNLATHIITITGIIKHPKTHPLSFAIIL